jgi:hypothetical protein
VSACAFARLSAVAGIALFLTTGGVAKVKAAPLQAQRFVGAAGCQSSSCHGGAGEKRGQYLTWSQQDFHARAYAVLTNARCARMAEALGLPAAQTSERCTVCHSPYQSAAPARLTKNAHIDEGVSCENCHGAADAWLRGHTRRDWTYPMRVGAGMRDVRNIYVRANTCVACHQNLDPAILRAGHPELTFELDGQSAAEPRHWRENDPFIGPRSWLVGQAVALREMSWMLRNEQTPDKSEIERWSGLVWLLAKTTADQAGLPGINQTPEVLNPATLARTQEEADLLARQAAAIPWSDLRTSSMRETILGTQSEFRPSRAIPEGLIFRRAARVVLALDRLTRSLRPEGNSPAADAALTALFEDVRSGADFQSAKFAADLKNFGATKNRVP